MNVATPLQHHRHFARLHPILCRDHDWGGIVIRCNLMITKGPRIQTPKLWECAGSPPALRTSSSSLVIRDLIGGPYPRRHAGKYVLER